MQQEWYFKGDSTEASAPASQSPTYPTHATLKPGAGYVPAPGRFSGSDLLSRGVAPEVSSALKGLTTVFGMGTGGSPLL